LREPDRLAGGLLEQRLVAVRIGRAGPDVARRSPASTRARRGGSTASPVQHHDVARRRRTTLGFRDRRRRRRPRRNTPPGLLRRGPSSRIDAIARSMACIARRSAAPASPRS
jgi:hypothetical protein